MLSISFAFSSQYLRVADSDNQTSVTNATRNAMTEAVNLGNQRVNEEVTINEDMAIEATLRMYAASSDFDDGGRYLNVYDVKSDPAFLAVESYTEIGTPIRGMLNKFSPDVKVVKDFTRSREIVIYEAKKLEKDTE
ncbi:hypothetical protein ABD91_01890 [Lysinibacillus sphaericus]|nr:hypothetical protein [Lysinibacillus sphaericus]